MDERDLVADLVEQPLDIVDPRLVVLQMEAEVEQRKLDLAHEPERGLKVTAGAQAVEQIVGQRRAVIDVV